jgi:predicted nucleotidyltransferase component of viral defense system
VTKGAVNPVASVLARLRTIAEKDGLSFNDILQSYVIERFLARLARSAHADTVLLKGALMLRVWGVPRARPTMDIDLLQRGNAEEATLVALVRDCAAMVDKSDGVTFDATTIVAEPIRDGTSYVGTRIRLVARLDNVRQNVQIDFGVGDAVHPQPATIKYPVLLAQEPLQLRAYSVETAIAEKFQAMVELDFRNSRMKDFYDIWLLSQALEFEGAVLGQAIRKTFERRQTPLPSSTPTALGKEFSDDPDHTRQWVAFVRRIGQNELASAFAQIISKLAEFLLPISQASMSGNERLMRWPPKGPWASE